MSSDSDTTEKKLVSLTLMERFWLSIIRTNQTTPVMEIRKTFKCGRLSAVFSWRSAKNLWGRFGGGWNWKLGISIGGSTLIVDLLIASLRFSWDKKVVKPK